MAELADVVSIMSVITHLNSEWKSAESEALQW